MQKTEFRREAATHQDWRKGIFTEAVSVSGPSRTIYFSGIGGEDDETGDVRHKDDFQKQCQYAYAKLAAMLARHGASFADVVKQVTYITDIRYRSISIECRQEAYADTSMPPHTSLCVSQLARPGMMVELDVIAVVGEK